MHIVYQRSQTMRGRELLDSTEQAEELAERQPIALKLRCTRGQQPTTRSSGFLSRCGTL